MKRSDIITIVLVAGIGMIAAYVSLNLFLGNPDEFSVDYSYIDEISSAVSAPNENVFNPDAINPTVEVYVGDCEDTDGDGTISSAERAACIAGSDGTSSSTESETTEGSTTDENATDGSATTDSENTEE